MFTSMLIRRSGPAAMLGGVLFAAKLFWDRNDAPPWPTDITDTLLFLIPLTFLIGLAGFYAQMRGRMGWLGGAGMGLALLGATTAVLGAVGLIFTEAVWFVPFGGLGLMFVGLVVLGIASIAKRTLPGWRSGLPLLMGMLGIATFWANPAAPDVYGDTRTLLGTARLVFASLFGFGWVLLGYTLWSAGRRQGAPNEGSAVTAPPMSRAQRAKP